MNWSGGKLNACMEIKVESAARQENYKDEVYIYRWLNGPHDHEGKETTITV